MSRSNSTEIIAAIDIGTSKIVALIAEINDDSELKIIGAGTHRSTGLKKGVVVNIEATIDSIAKAIEQAEQVAECEINTVFAGIAGSHVRSYDGHGFVRINSGEVNRHDIAGAIDASKAMKIPSEERILHVLPKDYVTKVNLPTINSDKTMAIIAPYMAASNSCKDCINLTLCYLFCLFYGLSNGFNSGFYINNHSFL
jgi:cell division protein FtsA